MKRSDFYFDLPEELIAQTPIEKRDESRLMLLDRRSGKTEDHTFKELPEFLNPGDCLVLNDSRVIPARLFGRRATGGAVEIVLLRDRGEHIWECLTRPGRKTHTGTALEFGEGELRGTVVDEIEGGNRLIRFDYEGIFLEVLERLGRMPLPPYIHEKLTDRERYQTVYARQEGSAAAPTAGLHFTPALMDAIRAKGVDIIPVLLHVGLGTFRPVKVDNVEDHRMHTEYFEVTEDAARRVNAAKASGGRVIAVGTTSVRTLESASENGVLLPKRGETSIFIRPGYHWQMVDGLITNFHLPGSTLIMLVSAFYDREHILTAYNRAVAEGYRFFSFGDAMFIE